MSIDSIKELIEGSYQEGRHWNQFFRKVFPLATTAGYVADLSMGTGNPRPNYYVGAQLEATTLNSAYGLWHGGNVSPATKHVHKVGVYSPTAAFINCQFLLCDYLLFYPLVDGDSLDTQELVNTTPLPRYSDGAGVKAFLVATNPYTSASSFFLTYTNHEGVSGRQSKIMGGNTLGTIGTILHSGINTSVFNSGPFIELQDPTDGIRSVESVTFAASPGGLFALVLVKPLATIYGREILAPAEWDLFTMTGKLPIVYDGAYLNFLVKPNGSLAGAYCQGDITCIWG